MKKILGLVAVAATITLASCGGGGLEADVRKSAEMDCKMEKLSKDTSKAAELEKLQKDAKEFDAEMKKKYEDKMKDTALSAKMTKIYSDIMEKCK